jgi:uncharacterized cupredoxin-like copper-binding protein
MRSSRDFNIVFSSSIFRIHPEEAPVNRPLAVATVAAVATIATATMTSAASSVSVTAGKPSEFHFRLSGTAHRGTVTFRITNRGSLKHDFKIAGKRTSLIGKGKTRSLTVRLKRGTYTYICTVPGHAAAGMKGRLRVR